MPSMMLFERSNEAVNLNAPIGADLHLTAHGSDWLWAAFSLFGVFAIAHTALFLKGKHPISHVAALSIASILGFTYFTLASDLGWTTTAVEFNHVEVSDPEFPGVYERQIFYAKYIGWFLGWPVLLFLTEFVGNGSSLAKWTHQTFATYALQVGAAEVFVLGLLISSLISSTYKWGYYTFSVAALLFFLTIFNYNAFKKYSFSKLSKLAIALFDVVLILYPISFGLSEGGNVIQPDSEAVFYGILDLIVFALIPVAFVLQSLTEEAPIPAGAHVVEKVTSEQARASGETAV